METDVPTPRRAVPEPPMGLLAELTYRCPLACAYCSNPIEIAAYRDELDTADWQRVVTEAAELGVLQLHLSGGEPLLRRDLGAIVATASELGLYTNLVTSALGLNEKRAAEPSPVKISPPHGVTYQAVASGGDTSYGISTAGHVYAWGAGKSGAVGDGTTHIARIPVKVESGATTLISSTSDVAAVALRR